jgi:hypothetical protein
VESAGTLTVSGLLAAPTLVWDMYTGYYPDGALPGDLFAAGDAVEAAAPGDAFPGFDLSAAGVATMESETITADPLVLSDSADLVVHWTPGDDPEARVWLSISTTNQAHGLPPDAILECDIADVGELVVPKELVAAMPDFRTEGVCVAVDCPPSLLARYRRGAATGSAGEVDLVVESTIEFYAQHGAP